MRTCLKLKQKVQTNCLVWMMQLALLFFHAQRNQAMELRRHNCEVFHHQDLKSLLWTPQSSYPSLQGMNSCVRFLAPLVLREVWVQTPTVWQRGHCGPPADFALDTGKLLPEIHVTLDALFFFIRAIFSHRFLMRNACMNVGEERGKSWKLVSDVLCSHQNSPVVC